MEGKEIAVWVYSNLDRVELFFNGQSLGAKEMKKDSHLAWAVKYAPGSIEARGYKGDKVVTEKRETTGPAAKLMMTADRRPTAKTWRCLLLLFTMLKGVWCQSRITR
jgi:beta-galactosidase